MYSSHATHFIRKSALIACVLGVLCGAQLVYAQGSLPIASTVTVQGESVQAGTVVSYNKDTNEYTVADAYNHPHAFGVTAERPALLFATASGTVPVVHEGTSLVRVLSSTTPIVRGSLLIASGIDGAAMVAGAEDEHVFAIALEAFSGEGEGLIQADVSVLRARETRASRQAAIVEAAEEDTEPLIPVTWIRGTIAALIAVGALGFMLFSFRSIVNNGVVSVGRNPRAQTSIVTFAFGTVLGVVLLGGLALFVAVAVLVLPV